MKKETATVMSAEELLDLCEDLRYRDRQTDDTIVARIRAEVDEYRAKFLSRPVPQLPPEPLRELLPLMGWLIYEASWFSVRNVRAGFESKDDENRERSIRRYRQVRQLANAARRLIWPEFAPRALGAIRALALAESKRDTEAGYDDAYIVHQEAADRHASYVDSHGDGSYEDSGEFTRERFLLDLDEVLVQLGLAETGTACRTAERVINLWAEEFRGLSNEDEEQWVQKMYLSLSDAVEIGGRALATAKRIKDGPGLVSRVDRLRLALVTGYRNPAIMTARAALLALALAPAMENLRRRPSRAATWKEERFDLIERVTAACHAIEEPVTDPDNRLVAMKEEHKRALIHLRLMLAVLVPGHSLPSNNPVDPCVELDPLDDVAVAAMSQRLSRGDAEKGPNQGNTLCAATLPVFIQSVQALRSLAGDPDGYRTWVSQWFDLGRQSRAHGRRERIEAAFAAAAARPSLRISRE